MGKCLTEGICPICLNKTNSIKDTNGFGGLWVECPKCGVYVIEESVFRPGVLGLRLRSCLYYYLTQQSEDLKEKKLIPDFQNEDVEDENSIFKYGQRLLKTISTKSILQLYPKDIHERIGMIMLNLSNEVQYIGNTFAVRKPVGDPEKYNLFFLDEGFGAETIKEQFNGILDFLEKQELIKYYNNGSNGNMNYKITPKGWELIDEYQKSHQNLAQGFIAMWFDESMAPAKKAIMSAVEKSGYIAQPIDMKEHNNQIVPEIFFEIKRSEFIVADLTGNRGGVYYEAGYAEGLGKPVILCCRADQFDALHFDVKQKSAIKWANGEDLEERLKKRIESTIGKRQPI